MIKENVPAEKAQAMIAEGARALQWHTFEDAVFCTVEVPDEPKKAAKAQPEGEQPKAKQGKSKG